jgi:thioesterase domain-containing protein/acyl carrier protein
LTGGDTLQKAPPKPLPFDVINNYGLTECSVVSTSGLVSPGLNQPPHIGRPIGETSIYLLDEVGMPVPDGASGEIYIGGPGVGRGYRNLAEFTAHCFLPDPFSRTPGARMFRTGDRASRLPNGALHFFGRLDRQVKIRGQRVELDEIGAALAHHPAIEFATAITRPTGTGTQLVACILPRKGLPEPTVSDLRAHLLRTLPDYMIPSAFLRLETPPLSANGKLDLKELARSTELISREPTSASPALSPIAEKLLVLVRQLLENNAVTANENFFLAGGHSLLAMQLLIRIEEAFGLKLAVHQLFDAPTVGDLAILLDRLLDESRLARIWKQVLDLQEVGLDDDFYALGGNPQSAHALREFIASEFGYAITIHEINSNPTIRRQAELTQGHATNPSLFPPGVLALRPSGSRSRIFWVHYLNTNLARVIGDDQPFFSVTLTADDVASLGERASLKSIAACLAAKIRATQSAGPYILGGLCLGGVLAYEIASQLRTAGEHVDLLVLIDPPDLVYAENRNSLHAKCAYFQYLMKRAEWLGPKASLMYLCERIVKRLPRSIKNALNIPNPNAAQQLIESAVYTYDPARYGAEALLLLASGRVAHETALAGWRTLIPFTLRTHYINAYHRELMESPNVEEIARAIVHHLPPGDHSSAGPFSSNSDSFPGNSALTGCPQGVAANLDVALQQQDDAA